MASDRITTRHAIATVALARLSGASSSPAGFAVSIDADGRARAMSDRTGVALHAEVQARWVSGRGFLCRVGEVELSAEALPRESRRTLLPGLLPTIEAEPEPVRAAEMALALARGIAGGATATAMESPEDRAIACGFARLLLRVLTADPPAARAVELALQLYEAAGAAVASGTPERLLIEERVAELMRHALPGAASPLAWLAARLGFAAS